MSALRITRLGLVLALLLTPLLAAEETVVERKRVVVRIEASTEPGFNYVFVGHQDGEPLVLETELAERGYLGVTLLDLTPELREHFGAPRTAGVMVSRVDSESPAAIAGVVAGDVVVSAGGTRVTSATETVHRISEARAGEALVLELRRDKKALEVDVTLDRRPRRQLDLGGLLRLPTGVPSDVHGGEPIPLIELDADSLGRALTLIRQHFDSSEWRQQVEAIGGAPEDLDARIRDLKERLRRVEIELDELPD